VGRINFEAFQIFCKVNFLALPNKYRVYTMAIETLQKKDAGLALSLLEPWLYSEKDS
jgi:hypothetical protein